MDFDQTSDSGEAGDNWASDKQEISALVEDFITTDAVPSEVQNRALRLHNSGKSLAALKIILKSLD